MDRTFQVSGRRRPSGAFLAGAVISASGSMGTGRHDSLLREKRDAIGFGFFIQIFFIIVGVRLDFRVLLTSSTALLLVPVLPVAAYAVKVLPGLLFMTVFSWR